MIKRIIIKNYKCIEEADIDFNTAKNIIVGNNGVGKSTLMEAMSLALGYGLSKFEITPYVFNLNAIREFARSNKLPEILIELYFDDIKGELSGTNNSLQSYENGLCFRIKFDELYADLYDKERKSSSDKPNLPCEYYKVERYWFSQQPVVQYKMPFQVQIIDTSSLYFSSSSTRYINHLIDNSLSQEDTISIKTSLRHIKEMFDAQDEIRRVNQKIEQRKKGLALSVDITSRVEKRDIIYPLVEEIPVTQLGSGEINHLKTILALDNNEDNCIPKVIILEEPESHLSHTKMYAMLRDIVESTNGNAVQLFITTHNSFVANKLDLSNLILLENNEYKLVHHKIKTDSNVYNFFQKVCHYPTLRMILCKAVILVEGPADEMVLTYYFNRQYNKHPFDLGIELISVGGTAFKTYVEFLKNFNKKVAIITDNDGKELDPLLGQRGLVDLPENIKVFTEADLHLNTLEPSFVSANKDKLHDLSNLVRNRKNNNDTESNLVSYMQNNKTDWSCRLLNDVDNASFTTPSYIVDAVNWILEDN